MNRVVLMGRLTRDPDVRYTQNDGSTCVARYTLAVDRRRARDDQGQTADFISCVAFGKSGEFAEKYFRRGTKIIISGRIQTGSYSKEDGTKVYTTDVVAEDQEFAESKKDTAGRDAMDDQNAAEYAVTHSRETSAAEGKAMGYNDGSGKAAGGHYEQQSFGGPRQQATGTMFMDVPADIDEELPFH